MIKEALWIFNRGACLGLMISLTGLVLIMAGSLAFPAGG